MSSISSISSSISSLFGIDQQKRKQELFNKVDSDGNSSISQTELTALTDKISEDSGKTLDASSLLSQYDSDSDGSLNSDEMDSLMESIKPKHERDAMLNNEDQSGNQSSGLDTTSLASYLSNSGQDLVSSLISMLQQMQSSSSDDEDDSSISSSSAINGKQGPPPPPPPKPEEMFSKVDSDSSGALSSDELQTMLDKLAEMTGQSQDASTLITQYDSDSDGALNSDEMDTMMKSMGPPPPPPQQAQSGSSNSDESSSALQSALASLLKNADQTSLSNLLKQLQGSSSGSGTSSLNVIS
ncbi:MAG: EF-hand domain-containing protein [Trichlorobacter sp.]|uniref:EF-hand domain-containing protein n=1 Tax=Trichlorobacter sp. TaxID=2911007 RepID=UPI00255EFF8A|nr:EF-hand domain-containing protein [Trichlorobacter sp.]MDK9717659.1 EF-hand domain-containing protein [Trichlorobacter sp.]